METDWAKVKVGTPVICSVFGQQEYEAKYLMFNPFTTTGQHHIVARPKDGKARNMHHCRLKMEA